MFVQPESEDDLKKLQLMELAIMNGTYRGAEGNIVPFVAAAVSRTLNSILLYCTIQPMDGFYNIMYNIIIYGRLQEIEPR